MELWVLAGLKNVKFAIGCVNMTKTFTNCICCSSVASKIKLPDVTLRAMSQYFTSQNGSKIKKLELVFRNLTVAKQFAAVLQQM